MTTATAISKPQRHFSHNRCPHPSASLARPVLSFARPLIEGESLASNPVLFVVVFAEEFESAALPALLEEAFCSSGVSEMPRSFCAMFGKSFSSGSQYCSKSWISLISQQT